MGCRHTGANWYQWFEMKWRLVGHLSGPPLSGFGFFDRLICDCGEWLGLGPAAADTPEVAIERRASLLATEWKPIGGVRRLITNDERMGWVRWPYGQPTSDGEWAGFLAAQIRNHERDLGEVNWAGDHMADHATHSDTEEA